MKLFISLILAFAFCQVGWAVETALTVVALSETASAVAANSVDTSNGNRSYNPNCDVAFLLTNTDVSNSATVTFTAVSTSVNLPAYGAMAKANNAVTLTAGQSKFIGPFPCAGWNNSTGYVVYATTGTGAASVKISPFRVPKR